MGVNGGPTFKHSEAFSFQIITENQAETDRYWNAIVGNGGVESQCGWCKDKSGLSWQIDLSAVPSDPRVLVFYGATQKKLPDELVVQAQPLGTRLTWIRTSGNGPNALDFHIAFYLGQELTHRPTSECTVLSKDTGFDPLIRHLLALGYRCQRVNSLKPAFTGAANPLEPEQDHFGRLVWLPVVRFDENEESSAIRDSVRLVSWLGAANCLVRQHSVTWWYRPASGGGYHQKYQHLWPTTRPRPGRPGLF